MCFEFDARPPALPADRVMASIAGGAAAEQITLTSADGTRFITALAESPGGDEPAVVILPDVRGLYRFYIELAERFAEAGHHAIVIDYFGRSAGAEERGEDFDFMAHLGAAKPAQVQADIAAAVTALRERTGATRFVSVGFCFGGANSFIAATNPDLGLDAAVGFYGTLRGERTGIDVPTPLDHASETRMPVLGMFGGGDELIPEEDRAEFEAALEAAGVEHEIVAYPGAPHSFFDRNQEEWKDESADAWGRLLDFLQRQGAPTAVAR
jgi:carboxymethylenebutenolidase